MAPEREAAFDQFFKQPFGRQRSPRDAFALAHDGLTRLEEELKAAGALGQAAEQGARADLEAQIHHAAISLGKGCLDGIYGLALTDPIDVVNPRRIAIENDAAPLDVSWQEADSPFAALAKICAEQDARLQALREQPNQLYRRLHESVALAADVAAWTAWTQISPEADPAEPSNGRD
ncbi:MAG: hypothetical protein ACTHKT_06810 [Solirubrobacterales bacterium]